MKNILLIFFLFISYNVVAQTRPSGIPSQWSTNWFRWGYAQADSGLIAPLRDTNWLPRFTGTIVMRPQTRKYYYYDSIALRWYPLVIDTTSLSNRINTKLNITDTTGHWWGIGKRWVDTVYRVNDSTVGYTINGGTQQTFQILGRSQGGGGGGSGTVTSVGLSMPSAFSVTNSPITTSGTIAVSGAGTSAQYIRGNGTLATTDTGMIPNYYLKVRGLLSGSSPITFSQFTGQIGVLRANTTGQLGVATFNNSDFTDNGSGLISLRNPSGGAGVDTIFRTEGIDSIYYTINGTTYGIKDSSGGSTQNISNTSLTANGNYIQNWSNKQWYVDSIAGQFLFRMGGVGSTGTRRKEFRINWGGSSFGDNIDGYNMFATIKKADLSNDSLRLGLSSSGTNVLSIGYFDVANSANNSFTSFNAPFGLLTISAKDSIWIKGAVPAATADSILGVVFRGANGISKIVKIPLSAAGGGGATLNNIGSGFRWVATSGGNIKTVYNSNTILWDSTSNTNGLTPKADTSVLATQYDLTQITPTLTATQIAYGSGTNTITSEALFNYNATNNVLNVDSVVNLKSTVGGTKASVGLINADYFRGRTSLGYLYTSVLPSATVTLDGNKMILAGGGGNSNNHITRNYWRGSENWTDTLTATVGTINASSFGFIYSTLGTNFSTHAIFYMANDGSGNFGKIQLEVSLGSVLTTSSGAVTLSTGDSIVCIINRSHNTWTATWNDITSATSCTVTYTFLYTIGSTSFNNVYQNRLYLYGGTQNIGSWKMTLNTLRNVPVIGLGNSIMAGHWAGTVDDRYMNRAFNSNYNLFDISAGPSDQISDIINKLPEILACTPTYVFIDIGTNDIANGMSVANFNIAYTNLIQRFRNAGVKVVVGAVTPRNSVNVTPYNAVIQKIATTYNLTYVDLFTPLKDGGTGLNPTYDAGDGLHINTAGNVVMASTVTSGAPELLIANINYTLQINNKPSYFTGSTIFKRIAMNDTATYNVDLPLDDSSNSLVNTGWLKRLNASGTAFINNNISIVQPSSNYWISGMGKALQFSLTPGVNLDASGGAANGYDGTSSLRATANNDVLSTFTANATYNDNA